MIFLTRKKLEKIIDDRIKQKEWRDFYYAEKVGYLINYDGLEWECVNESAGGLYIDPAPFRIFPYTCFGADMLKTIELELCGQTKEIIITKDNPRDMSFVTEGETK